MYITAKEVEDFIGKFPDDETLVTQYAESAQEMIKEYLGYNPELTEYVTENYGDNGYLFELDAFPLVELKSVSANGEELDTSRFRIKSRNYLEGDYGKKKYSPSILYKMVYTAGFEVETETKTDENGNTETVFVKNKVPAKIKTVALQLASLMWESAGGNLAVSSTTFADTGSRQFNNFTADRFLKELEPYKKGYGGNY